MSKKVIRIQFSNGECWEWDAEVIADMRAKYYARVDVERGDADDYDAQYKLEFDYTLGDNGELQDWMGNNLDWDDVRPYARLIENDYSPDYQSEWMNTPKDIITRD